MEWSPIQELLNEVERQDACVKQNIPTLKASLEEERTSQGVEKLCCQNKEYALLLTKFRKELSGCCLDAPNLNRIMELELLEPDSWKVLAFTEPSWFLDPNSMKQRSKRLQSIRQDHKGTLEPIYNDIWKDPRILEWASSDRSSQILVQGSYQTSAILEKNAIDLIEYLEAQEQQVAWILRTPPKETGDQDVTWTCKTVLKQIAVQILSKREHISLKTLALAVHSFRAASSEAECFDALTTALQDISIMYIVIDLGILGVDYPQADTWPVEFRSLFNKLQALDSHVMLKVVLLNCHPFPSDELISPIIRITPLIAARSGLRNSEGKRKSAPIQLDLVKRQKIIQEQNTPPLEVTPNTIETKIVPELSIIPSKTLKCVKCSRDWFDEMQDFEICVDASRKEPDERHPRVKIAVLDTGVDITHPDLSLEYKEGRIKYQSFLDDSTELKDLDGHGTHCTSLVAKFAPNAEIYVGRVFRKSVAEESSPMTLAKAIEYATTIWNVDIISLSLGFTDDNENLRKEIRKACAADTIIFAAAANNTTNESIPIRFPARMKEVICVFSSDAHGRPSSFNPPSRYNRENFTFPGERIEGAWPAGIPAEGVFTRQDAIYKYQDGTSCATPIAAAIAAGVLEFSWQEREPKIRKVELLKHCSGMRDLILKRMVDQHRIGDNLYHYVKPWKLISVTRLKGEIPIYISDTLENVDW